jgi:hypothetical protein
MEKRPAFKNSGIKSSALLDLVRNTAPFIFEGSANQFDSARHRYALALRKFAENPPADSDLWNYFELCISAHYATVGTFVPTDVDIAIREKLWSFVHSDAVFERIWDRTFELLSWDESPVSKRFVDLGTQRLSGHQGEWLTIAMGAYGTAKRIGAESLPVIRETIEHEVLREEALLRDLRFQFLESPDPTTLKTYLGGVAVIAHNLGDLDRMIDAYSIEDTDVLKRRVYRLGHEDARAPKGIFLEAGRVYQAFLASENHRNFALRAPKALRKSSLFLIPYGPFLDQWGELLVKEGLKAGRMDEREFREVVEALVLGWKKLNPVSIYTSQGYARALAGIKSALGKEELLESVPPVIRKDLTETGLRTLLLQTQSEFEKKGIAKLKTLLDRGSDVP